MSLIPYHRNMSMEKATGCVTPVTDVVDDAVGVPKACWYVAIVNHNSEKQASWKLNELGIENYLPTQSETRVWKNGRKSKVNRVVIPSTLFIHCTEQKRVELAGLPFIFRFMTNKAGALTDAIHKPLAVIPDDEIDRLKFMLGQTDVPVRITDRPFKTGDKARVIRGPLRGLSGEVTDLKSDRSELVVALNFFGCARLSIATVNLEKIK